MNRTKLKWLALAAAGYLVYILITLGFGMLDPQLTDAQSWVNVAITFVIAVVWSAYVHGARRKAEKFYNRGLQNYQEASLAWINACHGMYRYEPADTPGDVTVICRCKERLGTVNFETWKSDTEIAIVRDHIEAKLREIAGVLKSQWEALDELSDGRPVNLEEVKQTGAV